MKPSTFGFVFTATVATACHSAMWSPPEPQETLTPTNTPVRTAEPAPTSTSEPAPPTSASAPAAPGTTAPTAGVPSTPSTPSATATPEPAPPPSSELAAEKESPKAPKAAHKAPTAVTPPADAYTGPDPCEAKTFHYAAVRAACKQGGRKAVKDIMRGVVKKAKAAGEDILCTGCHEDTSGYRLKPNAVSDIKRWF